MRMNASEVTSLCRPGEERWDQFLMAGKYYYQYDFRTWTGKLFSTVRPTLELCRKARDKWLEGGAR